MGNPLGQEEDVFSCSCLKTAFEGEEEFGFVLGAADSGGNLKSHFRRLAAADSPLADASIRMVQVRKAEQLDSNSNSVSILRRESTEEKVLILFRHRSGHACARAVVAIAIVIWQGVEREICSGIYKKLGSVLPKYGNALTHLCLNGANCRCQKMDFFTNGSTRFDFGFSSSHNNISTSKALLPGHLFAQKREEQSCDLYDVTHFLADRLAHVYRRFAPKCFHRQIKDCDSTGCPRLGSATDGQSFNGVTFTMDNVTHNSQNAPKNIGGHVTSVMLTLSERSKGVRGVKQLHLHSYRLIHDNPASTRDGHMCDTSGGLSIECHHGTIVLGRVFNSESANEGKTPGRICVSLYHVTPALPAPTTGTQLKEIATKLPAVTGSERKPKQQPQKSKKKKVESSSPTDISDSSDGGESAAVNKQQRGNVRKKRKMATRREQRSLVKVAQKQQAGGSATKKAETKFAGFDSDA